MDPVKKRPDAPQTEYHAICPLHGCHVIIAHNFALLEAACDEGCRHKEVMGSPWSHGLITALESRSRMEIGLLLNQVFTRRRRAPIETTDTLGERPESLKEHYEEQEKWMYENVNIRRVYTFLVVNLDTEEVTQVFVVASTEPDARFKALRSIGVDVDNMDDYYIARRDQLELPASLD